MLMFIHKTDRMLQQNMPRLYWKKGDRTDYYFARAWNNNTTDIPDIRSVSSIQKQ